MKLRYNRVDYIYIIKYFEIKCSNIAFYRCWKSCLPDGIYKDGLLGLDFYPKKIENYPSGIKIKKIWI